MGAGPPLRGDLTGLLDRPGREFWAGVSVPQLHAPNPRCTIVVMSHRDARREHAMAAVIDVLAWDEGPQEQDRERFRVTNDEQATWAMRKATAARTRLDEITRIAEGEIERIKEWAEHESREPMRDLDYFEHLLTQYGAEQREQGRKTISTPYGSVKSRIGQSRYVFSDKQQFIEWARQHRPEWIAVKEEPSLSALHDANVLDAADPDTGEVIPGLEVEPPKVTFKVEVSK